MNLSRDDQLALVLALDKRLAHETPHDDETRDDMALLLHCAKGLGVKIKTPVSLWLEAIVEMQARKLTWPGSAAWSHDHVEIRFSQAQPSFVIARRA